MALSKEQIKAELDAINEEIARVQAEVQRRVKKLEMRAEVFADMLAETTPQQTVLPLPVENAEPASLRSFLQQALSDGKARELPELVKLVEGRGLLREDAVPGRAVHGALQAMRQIGLTRRSEDGRWSVIGP